MSFSHVHGLYTPDMFFVNVENEYNIVLFILKFILDSKWNSYIQSIAKEAIKIDISAIENI